MNDIRTIDTNKKRSNDPEDEAVKDKNRLGIGRIIFELEQNKQTINRKTVEERKAMNAKT